MPLIECPDCKRMVSDRASACIHCGCPTGNAPVTTLDPSPIEPSTDIKRIHSTIDQLGPTPAEPHVEIEPKSDKKELADGENQLGCKYWFLFIVAIIVASVGAKILVNIFTRL